MAAITFKRKAYEHMLKWKKERHGETALLIQGARRIGKTTIAETFARNEYKSHIIIDFSIAPPEVFNAFDDISNLDFVFFTLQAAYGVTLHERESVIVFDEVQMQPRARQAIKHLVKDGRYDYIETGSLISVQQSSAHIVIPSEETRLNMYPMDYEEFKWALGDTTTVPLLRQAFEQHRPLGNDLHRKMMRDFRLYMLVGGMPQAVAKYIQANNLAAVDQVKREIIELYEEDFNKIDNSKKCMAMFDAIPAQLSKNIARYRVSSVIPGGRTSQVSDLVRAMEDSMVANIAYHSNDPNAGLALTRDNDYYKIYTADTGLFITMAFKDKDVTENLIYAKLLNDKLKVNMGYVYENVVAQMLRATGKNLYYHTIPTHDGKKHYEVDFLVADGNKISPIEVKSSGYKTHASLDAFCDKFSERILNKYIIYTKDLLREGDLCYIPVYMTMFL
ncbi:MAG: AAA family ATPase [Muribaculaceae bacterium]|nr:AAA family ATPase [Muribaculaceae bacterium]